jgi:hypothetical protein
MKRIIFGILVIMILAACGSSNAQVGPACEAVKISKCIDDLCITQVVIEIRDDDLFIHFELENANQMPSNTTFGLKVLDDDGDRWLGGFANIGPQNWVCGYYRDVPYAWNNPADICGIPFPLGDLMDTVSLGETVEIELAIGSSSQTWITTACEAP